MRNRSKMLQSKPNIRTAKNLLLMVGKERVELYILAGCLVCSLLETVPGMWLAVVVTMVAVRALWVCLDQGLPIIQITAVLACLQWLVGPLWYYLGNYAIAEMGMAVSTNEYFSFAVPGTAAFCLGLFILKYPLNQRRILAPVKKDDFFMIGIGLNGCALVGDVAGRIGPESLAFAFFLLSQLRYVGVLYLWFSERMGSRWLAGLCTLPLFLSSAESAMFHDMLIWCGLLFSFWFASRRRTVVLKSLIVAGSLLLAFTIQGVKRSYRDKVWNEQEASLREEVIGFWTNFTELDREDIMENAMTRINQGWIVSRVLFHVPGAEPYAEGETIKNAVIAAAVPRFIYKDKSQAGGRDNFMRFTGLPINEQTSMNISLLGEGYANFGKYGGCVFLFVAGLGIASAFGLCVRFCRRHPLFIFWIPLIFYQSIKAETDTTEILNQIVKGGFLAFACYRAVEYVFPTKRRVIARPWASGPVRRNVPIEVGESLIESQHE
jgi:hypothetical protein